MGPCYRFAASSTGDYAHNAPGPQPWTGLTLFDLSCLVSRAVSGILRTIAQLFRFPILGIYYISSFPELFNIQIFGYLNFRLLKKLKFIFNFLSIFPLNK